MKSKLSRRRFLARAAGGAGLGLALPCVLTSAALGQEGAPPASDRVLMGHIGVGGMGGGHLGGFARNAQAPTIAVADVKEAQRAKAVERVGPHCTAYNDYRELLDRRDVDAVIIATPDHWHAFQTIHACQAGKDVYCEKPLSRTIAEGRAMVDAVTRYDRVFQTGLQQRSDYRFRHACELAINGRLGKVHTIQVGAPGGTRGPNPAPEPVPDGFDYEMWLGPAPWVPYEKARCVTPFWYHILDYSMGFVSGWGIHHVDIAQWGNGTDQTGPVTVDCRGVFPDTGICDAALTWHSECTYANGVKMLFTSNNECKQGVVFQGADGWVYVRRGFIDAQPKELLDEKFGPNDVHLYNSRSHHGNFVDCIRSREQTVVGVEAGHRSNTICGLSNISMRLGRAIRWDPEKEEILGDEQASRMLSRPSRAPWRL